MLFVAPEQHPMRIMHIKRHVEEEERHQADAEIEDSSVAKVPCILNKDQVLI